MWFKIEVYCSITKDLTDEEMSEIDAIRLKNEGILIEGYEKEFAYFNLALDNIIQLNPKVFIPKDGVNKRWATEVVFDSGNIIYAVGKPLEVVSMLESFQNRE